MYSILCLWVSHSSSMTTHCVDLFPFICFLPSLSHLPSLPLPPLSFIFLLFFLLLLYSFSETVSLFSLGPSQTRDFPAPFSSRHSAGVVSTSPGFTGWFGASHVTCIIFFVYSYKIRRSDELISSSFYFLLLS